MEIQEYEYHIQGYSDGYWKRLSESGLSENKLALIRTAKSVRTDHTSMTTKRKCLAVAASLNEMKMKCAVLGFEVGDVTF